MISAAWKWALLVVGVIGAVLAGLVYVISGVAKESNMSAYGRFFPEIVNRAIQLERIGEMRVSKVNWYTTASQFPSEILQTAANLRTFNGSNTQIDCTLDIEFPLVDPIEYSPALGTMLSYRPLRILVVFQGDIPDVDRFLNASFSSGLLGRIPAALPGFPGGGLDLKVASRIISNAHPNGFYWHGEQCERFSFIIFSAR